MSKFTPGPWCAHHTFPEFIVPVADADKKIGATENKWERHEFARIVHAVRGTSPERFANAALIAEAPAMAELLQRIDIAERDAITGEGAIAHLRVMADDARALLERINK